MSKEFKECLSRKKIIPFARAKRLIPKELKLAESDFASAKESHQRKNYKWGIIQSYYAMFHSARALLYNQGYRERSHYCLIVAIRALYVDKRLLSYQLVESLQLGKTLRENADYYGEFSKEASTQLLADTKEFIETTKKLTSK